MNFVWAGVLGWGAVLSEKDLGVGGLKGPSKIWLFF